MAVLDEPLTSSSPPPGAVSGFLFSARAVWSQRGLLRLLVRRELKARYKDSALGFAWSLLKPLTQLLIYYIAIGGFLGAARSIPQFAIYIFTGLTIWTFFSEFILTSTSSILDNAGLVKKVYLPRELFPLAAMGSALFNFAIQFGILLVAILVIQGPPFVTVFIWQVPIAFGVTVIFAFAIGLFLAAANVYLRDIKHLVEVAMLVLFWASPIVYSFAQVHDRLKGNWIEQLYLANPITTVVLTFQKGLWYAGSLDKGIVYPPDLPLRLLITLIVGLVLVWVSQRIFARLEGNFAQEI